eukprot:6495729-Prymnesium_polylepis.1
MGHRPSCVPAVSMNFRISAPCPWLVHSDQSANQNFFHLQQVWPMLKRPSSAAAGQQITASPRLGGVPPQPVPQAESHVAVQEAAPATSGAPSNRKKAAAAPGERKVGTPWKRKKLTET